VVRTAVERAKVKRAAAGREYGADPKRPPWALDHLSVNPVLHVRGSSEVRKRQRDDVCINRNSAGSSLSTLINHKPTLPLLLNPLTIKGIFQSLAGVLVWFVSIPSTVLYYSLRPEIYAAVASVQGKEKDVVGQLMEDYDNDDIDNEGGDTSEDENDLSALHIVSQVSLFHASNPCH
jgi:hypothetical protein